MKPLALSLALSLLAGCPSTPAPAQQPAQTPPVHVARPPIPVRIDLVGAEYQRNTVAADLKYGGRRLEFDGVASAMQKDGGVWLGLMLGGLCAMRAGQEEALAQIVLGQTRVVLRGTMSRMGRTPELSDCELVSHRNPVEADEPTQK